MKPSMRLVSLQEEERYIAGPMSILPRKTEALKIDFGSPRFVNSGQYEVHTLLVGFCLGQSRSSVYSTLGALITCAPSVSPSRMAAPCFPPARAPERSSSAIS